MQPLYRSLVRLLRRLPVWGWGLFGCGCSVTVLLIPVLSAIFAPIRAQEQAAQRARSCLDNVNTLTRSLLMYAEDYDDRLPVAVEWMTAARRYAPQQGSYRCPALPETQGDGYGYAFNSRASRLSLPEAPDPKTFPMIYDSANLAANASDPFASLPAPPRHLRNSIGYLDGHAVLLRPSPPPEGGR